MHSPPNQEAAEKSLFNFVLAFLRWSPHLKQLGDVEEAVSHEETKVAADLSEQRQLGVADKFRCNLIKVEVSIFLDWILFVSTW